MSVTITADEGAVKTKLKTKFFLFITMAIILVMAVSVFLVSRSTESQLKGLVRERLQKPLHGFKSEYANLGNESLDKVSSFVTNKELILSATILNEAEKHGSDTAAEAVKQCQSILASWLKSSGLDFVEIYAPDGKVLACSPPERIIRANDMVANTLGSLPEPGKEQVSAYGDGEHLAVIAAASIRDSASQPVFTVMAGFTLDDLFIKRMKELSGLEFVLFSTQNKTRFCVATTFWADDVSLREKNKPLIPSYFDPITGSYGELYVEGKYSSVGMIPLTTLNGTYIGEIWGGLSADNLLNTIQGTRRVLTMIGLIAVLLFSVAGYIFTGRITSPLQKLQDGISAISKGDYNTRVEVESTDELGALARAFNTMSRELQNTISKLSAIYEVNGIMNTCSDPVEVAEMMAQILQLGFGVNTCAILLPQHGSDTMAIQANFGLSEATSENFTVIPSQGKLGASLDTKELLVLKDHAEITEELATFSEEDREKVQFIMCQPMVSGEKIAGLLCIFALDSEELNDELARFFGLFASLMGPTLLYTATLQEQETSAVNLFEALKERVSGELDRAAQYMRPVSLAKVALKPAPTVRPEEWTEALEDVMVHFATASRDMLPHSSIVVRGGSNSFYLILPGKQAADTEELLKQVEVKARSAVEQQFDLTQAVATHPENATTASALIAAVD